MRVLDYILTVGVSGSSALSYQAMFVFTPNTVRSCNTSSDQSADYSERHLGIERHVCATPRLLRAQPSNLRRRGIRLCSAEVLHTPG